MNKVEPEAARISILGRLVAGVAFLAVLVPLAVRRLVPTRLARHQDVDDLDFVIFTGLAITQAIGASHPITHAFRRRNLAKRRPVAANFLGRCPEFSWGQRTPIRTRRARARARTRPLGHVVSVVIPNTAVPVPHFITSILWPAAPTGLSDRRTAQWRNVVFCGVNIFRIADGTIVERSRPERSSRSRARSRTCGPRTQRR